MHPVNRQIYQDIRKSLEEIEKAVEWIGIVVTIALVVFILTLVSW